MKVIKNSLFAVMALITLFSCSLESSNPPPIIGGPDPVESVLDHGFFVTNEGQFPNSGSVSFISNDLDVSEQKIYLTVNGSGDLGSGLQSMFFDTNGHAFIISNGGNFITAVNRSTFEHLGRAEMGLEVPRYGVVVGEKIYVTNQGDFTTPNDDYVAVLSLQDLSLEKKITVGSYLEHIFRGPNDLLYIEGAAFDQGNSIAVLDPSSDEIVQTIETADALNSIALDNANIYALTAHKLQKFDLQTGELEKEIELEDEQDARQLRYIDGNLYYTIGSAVFKYNTSFAEEAPSEPILSYTSGSEYGAMYGFEVHKNRIYIADAGDFTSKGFVEVFSAEGSSLGKLDVGVGPNGFYFND